MPAKPTRKRIEPGIYERLSADGRRLGLEVVFKDSSGRTRRRSVSGGIEQARDLLAQSRTRRVKQEREPADPRVSFDYVADLFEAAHVAGLRIESQDSYHASLVRLRKAFGRRRISSITKLDLRALIAAERDEGLKANTTNQHLKVLSVLYSFARDDLDMAVMMPKLKPAERPRPADDAREHRVLTDIELAAVLEACDERFRLYFRTLAETGARKSEILGLTTRRIGPDTITIAEQLGRDGRLGPVKTRQSRRTIEITRSLAAALTLTGGPEGRVFEHLNRDGIRRAWLAALMRAQLADPQPVIHDLRHTHVSGLIADGWDPMEVAARIGDILETTLRVYSHEFDVRRRSEARRGALEARYGVGMATHKPLQSATDRSTANAEIADLQVFRNKP